MEGAAQTGSSDIYGAGNNGRSFDFNVFPTEIFSQLAVRKTPSADVEEGSLGATVDLKAPRPFDFDQDWCSPSPDAAYTTRSAKTWIRACRCCSRKKFFDDTFGVLASAAFQKRNIREVGYSAVDILSEPTPTTSATATAPILLPFCTPHRLDARPRRARCPARAERRRRTAAPATPAPATWLRSCIYNRLQPASRDAAATVPGSGAFLPRLPRYVNSEQDTERTGGTLSLQWQPTENTRHRPRWSVFALPVERRDNYILGLSFGRNLTNNGQPMVSVRDIAFDEHGSVTYGLFDGVDVRSEGLVDQFVSTFEQVNLTFEHRFTDTLQRRVPSPAARSTPGTARCACRPSWTPSTPTISRSTSAAAAIRRIIGFGFDVNNPASFTYAPTPDGNQTVLGGFSLQGKPSAEHDRQHTFDLDGDWQITDHGK